MTDTTPSSSSSTAACDYENRRRSPRRPPLYSRAMIWVGTTQQVKARVIDESDGGVGLHVPYGVQLFVGLKVRVEQGGTRRWATIRHVTDSQNGTVKAGLSWD